MTIALIDVEKSAYSLIYLLAKRSGPTWNFAIFILDYTCILAQGYTHIYETMLQRVYLCMSNRGRQVSMSKQNQIVFHAA